MSRNAQKSCIEEVNAAAEDRETHRREWLESIKPDPLDDGTCRCVMASGETLTGIELISGRCATCGRMFV